MAKSKEKKGKGKGDKKKKDKATSESTGSAKEAAQELQIVEPEVPKDIRTITIRLESYRNIIPFYRVADIKVSAQYLENNLGETEKIPIAGNELLECEHEFKIEFDANSPKSLDQVLSNPVTFTVTQIPGDLQDELVAPLQQAEDFKTVEGQYESVISIYEAISGVKVDIVEETKEEDAPDKKKRKKSKGKGKKDSRKSSKSSKDSKGSKGSKGKKRSADRSSKSSKGSKKSKKKSKISEQSSGVTEIPALQPITYGVCVLDLLPLFHGNGTFSESLPIKPIEILTDEQMVTYKNFPQLTMNVSISQGLELLSPSFLYFTLESLYNIPSIMKNDVEYKIAVVIPTLTIKEPIMFFGGGLTSSLQNDEMKRWPGLPKMSSNANTTLYKMEMKPDDIKDKVGIDLPTILNEQRPRIEFNCLNRALLSHEDCLVLLDHLRKYRKLVLEIYMIPKVPLAPDTAEEAPSSAAKSKDKGKKGSSKGGKKGSSKGGKKASSKGGKSDKKGSSKSKSEKSASADNGQPSQVTSFLHLMALIDVSYLLNPGITRVRVACPLTTFHYREAELFGGLMDSYFIPKPVPVKAISSPDIDAPTSKKGKKDKKGKKEKGGKGKKSKDSKSKSSKSKSSKSKSKSSKSKSSKSSKDEEQPEDLKDKLPPEPPLEPEPEPSVKVFNESGERTFVIVEISLSAPLVKKRTIEDLTDSLQEMITQKPKTPEMVLTTNLAEEFYREVVKQIIRELCRYYLQYKSDKAHCICAEKANFLTYLRRLGALDRYLFSLLKSVSLLTTTKFTQEKCYNISDKVFQNFIAEVYVYLISEMNTILNKTLCLGKVPKYQGPMTSLESLLLYAKEATELRAYVLAERYYLERISREKNDPDYWFDYAVYNLEMKNPEVAFECIYEALSISMDHRNSLLLYAMLLADKNQKDEAETCFLTLLVQHPRCIEAWGTLYLFYQMIEKYEGMELCIDMSKKYMEEPIEEDYFMGTDDLAWTCSIIPKTLFFRTACVLIKMRMLHWAESALSHEILKNAGLVSYLLAVIKYYKRDITGAFEKIKAAKELYGSDYAITSLYGHLFLAQSKYQEAKNRYYYLLEAYNRPDDLHLVHINCAIALEELGCNQEARKVILIACKYNPTPYTWMTAGILYYKVNDLISAEACFSEANFRDNRIPETWAYLSLINLKMDRICEAELCYKQAKKNNLCNPQLMKAIREQIKICKMKQQ